MQSLNVIALMAYFLCISEHQPFEANVNVRIIHECAYDAASKLVSSMAHLFHEEDQRDAYGECFEIVKEALTEYAVKYDKLLERLK